MNKHKQTQLDLPSENLYPESVDIGGLIYAVEPMPEEIQDQLLGQISEKKLKIYLHPEMAVEYGKLVLMHEITHGFGFTIDEDFEEQVVERLSRVILNFLRGNHELVAWLANMDVVE